MHIITCKPGHTIEIKLKPDVHPDSRSHWLFDQGNIEIFVGRITSDEIKLAIVAPRQFTVLHNQHWG